MTHRVLSQASYFFPLTKKFCKNEQSNTQSPVKVMHKESRILCLVVLRIQMTFCSIWIRIRIRFRIRARVVRIRGNPDLQHCSPLQHISLASKKSHMSCFREHFSFFLTQKLRKKMNNKTLNLLSNLCIKNRESCVWMCCGSERLLFGSGSGSDQRFGSGFGFRIQFRI